MAQSTPVTESTGNATTARQANYVLAVLFVVMMLNFLDRQVISIVAEPIKRDLGLTDTQLGWVTGLSFAILYTTLAIPAAALADRWNRSRIIAIAVAIWSLMTVFCGIAANLVQLILARVGVGIGEAGSSPASHSLIADLFPPEKRSGALGILGTSIPIGAFIAYAGGGWITENISWRAAFLIAGAPGILVAIVMWFTVKDPRGHIPITKIFTPQPGRVTTRDALIELSSKPSYWHLVAAGVLVQFVSYGLASFYGGLFVRVHGIGYGELGWKLGVMVGLSGGIGAWLGGKIGDILAQRHPSLPLLISGMMLVIAAPGMVAAVYADNVNVAIALLAFPTFAATFYFGPSFAAIQSLASDQTRAMAVAIYLLIAGLIGLSLGPVFTGTVSDYLSRQPAYNEASGLQMALTYLALFNIWAGFHYWRAEANMDRRAKL